ncbi:MAG: benzoyl-CoA-dihydrodiol lyase [Betaproteobacteria bacterium]|nr:benzoyl-CoA-dihydrodiol lyase [Betaproteobacteria bacterium]MBT6530206.1 benzoyl-CoA-dihydrodiol lyase [Betaproteobacteria bacterium]MBT7998314.1 benzoyl-CoA-dihydrodiol lyase [Betaproteobacteria bacterium]
MQIPKKTESDAIDPIFFDTHPDSYQHWNLSVEGDTATLSMDVNEDAGLKPGYKLKLNSYDLGVDIELYDAINRVRFEHPNVRCVVITSAKERMFCSGANIYMLGQSSHSWKVNFCKFTNETRNGIEDSSRNDGLKFLASINGTIAGGGYELALACDKLLMIDDRSSSVSLPEVPLLGVLPGTGGLTRVIDKRKVRRDLADVFCSMSEGVRADRAKSWSLVDEIAKPNTFKASEANMVKALISDSIRPVGATGISLNKISRTVDPKGIHYATLDVEIDRAARTATIIIKAPSKDQNLRDLESIHEQGCEWWPLKFSRELDDAILLLRTNELEIGTWIFRTVGNIADVLEMDTIIDEYRADWLVRETVGMIRRTLARLDVSSRTMFALIDEGSCFAGTLFEIALASDRIFMLSETENGENPNIALSQLNFDSFPMVNHLSRIDNRFYGHDSKNNELLALKGEFLDAQKAIEAGLVTFAPDDIDWDDELRIAIEERGSLSPDALSGMEANLRFSGPETMETRIFARLSAWQNWIFIRPNAVGDQGALKVFGSGKKPEFAWQRI